MVGLIIWLTWLGVNAIAITTSWVLFGGEKLYERHKPFKVKWLNGVYEVICVATLVFVTLHIAVIAISIGLVKGIRASKNKLPEIMDIEQAK